MISMHVLSKVVKAEQFDAQELRAKEQDHKVCYEELLRWKDGELR